MGSALGGRGSPKNDETSDVLSWKLGRLARYGCNLGFWKVVMVGGRAHKGGFTLEAGNEVCHPQHQSAIGCQAVAPFVHILGMQLSL